MNTYLPYLVYGSVIIIALLSLTLIIIALTNPYQVKKTQKINLLSYQPPSPPINDKNTLFKIREKLRYFWNDKYKLTTSDINIYLDYEFDISKQPHAVYDNWSQNYNTFNNFCIYGINLLRSTNYINKITAWEQKKIKIADNILTRINLQPIDDIKRLNSVSKPQLISNIVTLAAMFQLISDVNANKLAYHRLIITLVPEIPALKLDNDKIFLYNASNLLNLSIPRILTNYINDSNNFIADLKSKNLRYLDNVINNHRKASIIVGSVINIDSSAFIYDFFKKQSYINYSNYLQNIDKIIYHSDLYAAVNIVLDLPGNYYKVVKKLAGIIIHPIINNIIDNFNDLYDPICDININLNKFQWLDIKGQLGCFIIPSIGLGILKTKKLMFSILVSMPEGTRMCDIIDKLAVDKRFSSEFMQLRKIYFAEFYDKFEWIEKKNVKPGVIIQREENIENSIVINDYSKNNYIGRLDQGVLFWKTEYKLLGIGCEVLEFGVFSEEGLRAHYEINISGNKDLYFRWQDYDPRVRCWVDARNFIIDGDYVKMAAGNRGTIQWLMMVGDGTPSLLQYKYRKLTFSYDGKSYVVEELNLKHHFKVECDGDLVMIGGNSMQVDHVINYKNIYYRRDETMMYKRE